jgi:hypothetical protein
MAAAVPGRRKKIGEPNPSGTRFDYNIKAIFTSFDLKLRETNTHSIVHTV